MARKIFVSYKHSDSGVQPLNLYGTSTARDYVDKLVELFDGDHIYKGERDNDDLGAFKEDNDQWIPWEIAYSLREKTREGRTSLTNAMLAVVVPDEYGSYNYFVESLDCVHCNGIRWKTEILFSILGKNMFNRKKPNTIDCRGGSCGTLHTGSNHSYIHPVRWDHFISDINFYINHVALINENIA